MSDPRNQGDLGEKLIARILEKWRDLYLINGFVWAKKGGELDFAGIDFVIVLKHHDADPHKKRGPQIFLQVKTTKNQKNIRSIIKDHLRIHPLVTLIFFIRRMPRSLNDPTADKRLTRIEEQLKRRINNFIVSEFGGKIPVID